MNPLCFCRDRRVDLEHATYAINGVPACSRECYEEALEAQGVGIHHIVQVAYRRPALVAS